MDPIINAIAEGWRWKLGQPVEVVATNLFGNAIVKNDQGLYFRIVPEEWSCELIANSTSDLEQATNTADFIQDWEMTRVIALAVSTLGSLAEGQVYCLVTPGILGGKYDAENIKKISLREVLAYSGDMAKQINGLPDGANVQMAVTK